MKIKELVVRSAKSADLSLAVGGIIQPVSDAQIDTLSTGAKVKRFSLERNFLPATQEFDTDGKALLNSNNYLSKFDNYCLAFIRHQQGGFELDKIVLNRARAYLERYKDIEGSANRLNTFSQYRLNILNTIEKYSKERTTKVNEAHEHDEHYSNVLKYTSSNNSKFYLEKFIHPILDTHIQDEQIRLEASMLRLSAEQENAKCDNRLKFLQLELEELNKALFDAQLGFLDSFLFSPFDGIVTQAYKSFGELVRPGEPIIRVENWDDIRLIARVQTKTMLKLEQKLTLLYAPPETNSIEMPDCEIVSVRGYKADEDEWEVSMFTKNTGSIPPGYQFDQRYVAVR